MSRQSGGGWRPHRTGTHRAERRGAGKPPLHHGHDVCCCGAAAPPGFV